MAINPSSGLTRSVTDHQNMNQADRDQYQVRMEPVDVSMGQRATFPARVDSPLPEVVERVVSLLFVDEIEKTEDDSDDRDTPSGSSPSQFSAPPPYINPEIITGVRLGPAQPQVSPPELFELEMANERTDCSVVNGVASPLSGLLHRSLPNLDLDGDSSDQSSPLAASSPPNQNTSPTKRIFQEAIEIFVQNGWKALHRSRMMAIAAYGQQLEAPRRSRSCAPSLPGSPVPASRPPIAGSLIGGRESFPHLNELRASVSLDEEELDGELDHLAPPPQPEGQV